jgi:N-acyl-D-amino-acid deacylase
MDMFDTILIKGCIVDRTGNPWFRVDIGVKGGRVVKIGNLSSVEARSTIDAKDFVVCPGFIDIHPHSDIELLINPRAESKVRQGVNTEVNGNCAHSPPPVTRSSINIVKRRWYGLLGDGVTWEWSTIADYLNQLEKQGTALNVATLAGHGTLIVAVMGYEKGPLNRKELEKIKALLAESLEFS